VDRSGAEDGLAGGAYHEFSTKGVQNGMKRILMLILVTLAILPLTSVPSVAAELFSVINTQKLKAMLDESDSATVVIDSRSRSEYDQAHIAGAVSLPLSQMTANLALPGSPTGSKLVFYCSGST
jgi:hypothetical protein